MTANNRTLRLEAHELQALKDGLGVLGDGPKVRPDTFYWGDALELLPLVDTGSCDLIILDPPYMMRKKYGDSIFPAMDAKAYEDWLGTWVPEIARIAKPTATVYVCGDWRSSGTLERVFGQHFLIHNRITWEREKGRGSLRNWKNASEDIWFCTKSDTYHFDANKVLSRRSVRAPYTQAGAPKDWVDHDSDGRYRDTLPSNLWTDCTVPFWSMPENTPHPTQKPEKLIARLILASSQEGDLVFDPFGGSGTTAVVAKKLKRSYLSFEREESYALLAIKRLNLANSGDEIQGYSQGVFFERNYRPRGQI